MIPDPAGMGFSAMVMILTAVLVEAGTVAIKEKQEYLSYILP